MIGHSYYSVAEDIFGPTVNVCSKINSMGSPNEMIVGNDFYLNMKSSNQFQFSEIIQKNEKNLTFKYPAYRVTKK